MTLLLSNAASYGDRRPRLLGLISESVESREKFFCRPLTHTAGVDDQQALLIGIRCERGSHTFFKKYADKFEDSEGKQIFAEFAAEEKQHLELLLKEYRELVKRQSQSVKPAKRVASRTRKTGTAR